MVVYEYFQRYLFRPSAWMGSFAMASSGLFGPIAGRLTDRFGARAVVVCGSLMSATGLLLTSLVPNLYLMLLTYGGIFGFGSSLIYISIFEIVPRCFIKHRSLATGLITMSTGASLVVMSPVCQALIDAYGWRGAFRGMSGCALVIFVMGWTLDPNVAREEAGESVEETKPSKTKETSKILDLSMWRNITFVVLAISSFFVFIGHTIPIVHLVSNLVLIFMLYIRELNNKIPNNGFRYIWLSRDTCPNYRQDQ